MKKPARRDGRPDRRPPHGNDAPAGTARRSQGGAAGGRSAAPKKPHTDKHSGEGAGKKPGKKGSPAPDRRQGVPRVSNAKPARHQVVAARAKPAGQQGQGVRLQKVLAQAGVASRRAAEELIEQGRVEVDGAVVRHQGLRVDPNAAVIRVDGTRVVVDEELVYLALNKPRGWHSTMSDDQGRPCVGDIVAERVAAGQRLFHVGRLDADTEGLLLLTNDGELAHRLMHPSFEVSKTYLATVTGIVSRGAGRTLRAGVELDDGPARVDQFTVLDINEGKSLVKIVLHEGRKHIVRRLLDSIDHPVVRLVRTDIGPVALGEQRPGTLRALNSVEIGGLFTEVGL